MNRTLFKQSTLTTLFIVAILAAAPSYAASYTVERPPGFYPDEIVYFEVSDEDLAISQVIEGEMDIYLWRLPAAKAFEALKDPRVTSIKAASSYVDLLFNPAPAKEGLNPFAIKEFRQLIAKHLIDRSFVVKENLKGLGEELVAGIGPFHPDYVYVIDILETEKARAIYDPALVEEEISRILAEQGAVKIDGKWTYNGEPIVIKVFARSDDPVRKSIGDRLALELEKLGFTVEPIYGDLRKAFNIVYGTSPSDVQWHVYTEGWAFTAITKYDDTNAAFFYAPWLGNMPGWGETGFWQYEHPQLDEITKTLAEARYSDLEERATLLRESLKMGLEESVRTFVSVELTNFLYNKERVENVAYDLFGGPWTPWFYRTVKLVDTDVGGTLRVGQKLMYQGAYNPVGGFRDLYSVNILRSISDPATWPHPHTGRFLPYRVDWKIETAGPDGRLAVPPDALAVDLDGQRFVEVGPGVNATTKVVYTVKMSNWHHGEPMSLADLVYPFFFLFEWGVEQTPGDPKFDGEFSRGTTSARDTFVAFKPIADNVVEVYFNYWHPDETFIGAWLPAYSSTPWELTALMEDVVANQKAAFSQSRATSLGVDWLDLTKGPTLQLLSESLEKLSTENFIPEPLKPYVTPEEAAARWSALKQWYETYGHFQVSNGPYFFFRTDVPSKQDIVKAFRDPTYPFKAGDFDFLVTPRFAEIVAVEAPSTISPEEPVDVTVQVEVGDAPSNEADVIYMLFSPDGEIAVKGEAQPSETPGEFKIELRPESLRVLEPGAYSLQVLAVAHEAARPSTQSTVLLLTPPPPTPEATPQPSPTPETTPTPQPLVVEQPATTPPTVAETQAPPEQFEAAQLLIVVAVIVLAIAAVIVVFRLRRAAKPPT